MKHFSMLLFFMIYPVACNGGSFSISDIKLAYITATECAPLVKEQWKRVQPFVTSVALPVACGAFGIIGTRYWLNSSTQSRLSDLQNTQEKMKDTLVIQSHLLASIENKTITIGQQLEQLRQQIVAFFYWWKTDCTARDFKLNEIVQKQQQLVKLVHDTGDQHSKELTAIKESVNLLTKQIITSDKKLDSMLIILHKVEPLLDGRPIKNSSDAIDGSPGLISQIYNNLGFRQPVN
jgi:hypothetical protein